MKCTLVYLKYVFITVVLTVKFDETTFEHDQMVQLTLILDNPSPFNETVQLININDTAYGIINICK